MSNRIELGRGFLLSSLIIAGAFASCIDVTPVVVVDDSQRMVGVDAGESACVTCIRAPDMPGPGCATEVAACFTNARCHRSFDCGIATGCWNEASPADSITCVIQCGEKEKIAEDPAALEVATTVFNCT